MNAMYSREDALLRIEKTVLRNQARLVPYEVKAALDPITRNASVSHAGWETSADGQHAFLHVLLKRKDAELLMAEMELSYEELYDLMKEVSYRISLKQIFWLNAKEIQRIHGYHLMHDYQSPSEFGICVGDRTDISVYGNWVS